MIENISSSNRFTDKYARAKKILMNYDELENKFSNMLTRGSVRRTLTSQCAWAVLVMMSTGIRVGNEKSAEGYTCINKYSAKYGEKVKTYGITTLKKEHTWVSDGVNLNFIGKKQVAQSFRITDKLLILCYMDFAAGKRNEERLLDITHYDLTKFVKRYIGRKFTIKDIRTAKVNQLFIQTAEQFEGTITRKTLARKTINYFVRETAEKIGHTPAVCKRNYISKDLINYYEHRLMEQTI